MESLDQINSIIFLHWEIPVLIDLQFSFIENGNNYKVVVLISFVAHWRSYVQSRSKPVMNKMENSKEKQGLSLWNTVKTVPEKKQQKQKNSPAWFICQK